jgi:hypothetical protein
MSTCGRNLIGNLKTLAVVTLTAVVGLWSPLRASAQATISPSGSYNFGNIAINQTSLAEKFTFKNTGASSITINSLSVTAATPYAIGASSTCLTPTVNAGGSCTIYVTVEPTALGAVPTGTLTVDSTASNSPQTVTLNATGVEPITLTPNGLGFGSVVVGTTSGTLAVSLANNQPASVTISAISITPGNGFAQAAGTNCAVNAHLTFHSSCNIAVNFTPGAAGPAPASTVSVTTTQSATPVTIPLTGIGGGPTLVSPANLHFSTVPIGQTSLIQTFTIKNQQSSALSIASIVAPTGGYAIDPSTTCANPGSLGAGLTCSVGVTFTPTAAGTASGSVVVTTNASNSPQSVSVSGAGVVPLSPSRTTVYFGNATLNQTSAIQTVTLTNNQPSQSVSFSSIGLTGNTQFAINPTGTCSTSSPLAAGASCTLAFTFTPTALGTPPNATVSVGFNASNSPISITLSGNVVQDTTVSPGSIAFGAQTVGTHSPTKTVTLSNLQASTLSISQVIFAGPFILDTSSNTTCPIAGGAVSGTLAGNSSCVIGVIFAPTAAGFTTGGQMTVISSSPNSPLLVNLSGDGQSALSLSPSSLAFGNLPINVLSAPSNIVVSNNQSANLDFSSIAVPAPYSIATGTTTCVVGTPVLPGKNCTVSVTAEPTALGAVAASALTLSDDAPSSPQVASLSASGVPPVAIVPSTLGFAPLAVHETGTQTAVLTNYLSTPIVIDSIASFTSPYTLDTTVTTCPLTPATLGPGLHCTIGIDVTPTTTGSLPGSATLIYNASGSSTMVDLPIAMTASASQPIALSQNSVYFTKQFVGFTSPATTIELKNLQSVPLSISGITLDGANPGDFAISSNLCPVAPATLAANSNCTFNVTFTPVASGGRNATVSIADNALGSPQIITLYGPGNAPITLSTQAITNFTANVGAISNYQTVTITNQTTTPFTINAFQFTGNFEETSSTCGASLPYVLAGGASCNLTISFAPTIGGTRSGQLQIIDTAATSPQVINLQGVGQNPLTLSTSSLVYSAQLVNTTSPNKLLTLINHESQSESFTLTPSGPFSSSTNCTSGTIAANSTCNIYVSYSPTTVTPPTQGGTVTVTDSAPGGSPLVLGLTGTASATNPAPAVSVVSPGAAAGGSSPVVVNVTITGNGWTHFSNSSVITFPVTSNSYASDITVNSFTAVNANTINASITLAASPVFGARNIQVVTPLSGGGNETASLNSAFIISDPTQTFEITSITPGVGTQGQGYLGVAPLTVDITATGTSFVQGTTYANFGDGVSVESLDITGPTTATAVLAISNTTTVGYRTVTMVTGGQVANSVLNDGNPLFYIGPNSATLTGVFMANVVAGNVVCTTTPASEPQSFAGPVCLTATGTHFLQNATGVSITGGVTVGDTIVTSPTTAYANVIVTAGATIGLDNVTVATGGEIASLANSFQVTGSTPALVSVTPSSGQQGQSLTVTVTGNSFTNFATCPGGVLTADFTGVISSPTVNVPNPVTDPQQVTIPISINENAPTGGITANLTCGGAGSATIFPFSFTILPSSASITSVTPSSVPQGGQVTLTVTGQNTDWSQADTMSAFYPTPIANPMVNETTILSATSAQLNISVPTNTPVGTYCFYMATGGQIVSACIQVYANTPTLTMSPANGLVPTSGNNPISVTFTGQFTHFSQAGTVPVIAGEGVTLTSFTVNNPDSVTGTVNIAAGAATGSRLVTFTTGNEIVTTYFNVTTIPVGIVSVSPWHGPQSTTMNVEIVGLNTHFVSGSTQVVFGGPQITVNTVTVNSPTDLIANITTSYTPHGGSLTPTPPGWNAVYINDSTEQLITGFLVDAPATPSIVSACVTADLPTTCVSSAPQGSGGTNVTITGSLTNWIQGSSQLTMGAGITVANLNITSPTTATATISVSPTAPVGGNSVVMVTPLAGEGFEYDSGVGFSVTPSAAYITDVSLPACENATDANFIANFCNNGTSNIVPVISQLQTSMLNVTGLGTHWLQGETTMNFGSGVVVDQLTINSPTSATVQITVLSSAPVGFATATASTDGENASLVQAIDIEEGSPTFLAFSPQGAQQGATLNVEVLGRFTNWSSTTPPVAEFNQDITINSLTVVDSETLVLNVTVSPWAYVDTGSPCGHVLTITSGNEQVSSSMINDNFCVSNGAQQITGVSPNAAGQGSSLQVTITGSQTNFLAGQTQVSFGDAGIQIGTVTVTSPTLLTVGIGVTTTANPGFHNVTVSTYGQVATQADAFTASPTVAQLTEAIANQAEQGVQNLTVRLIGQYTHFSTASTATFGAGITVVGTPTWVSDTEIDAVIDISPISYVGGRTVTVATPGISCANQPPTNLDVAGVLYQGCTPGSSAGTGTEIVNANVFSIIQGPAIITGMTPNTGNEGQEIVATITGLDTHWQQNFTQFYIAGGGSDITINDVIINSATNATVDMTIAQGATAGPRSIYMITAGESLTDSGAFVVTGGVPAVSYLTPNNAQPGTTELQVTVVGNAYTQWSTASGTTVNFGPGITIVSQEVTDASHIVADITVGPTCTAPNTPAGCAQYGYRTVVVQTGTQGLTGSFDVVPPPPPPTPYVWYEAPSSALPGQTVSVYFYGANTQWTDETTLTGWDANNVTVNTYQVLPPSEAIANITINPSAPAEQMGLTFTTNGTTYNNNGTAGLEVDDASFNIVIAQPTLSIVDPGSGMQGAQNITVNILGQFTAFDNTTTFSFGGANSGITVVGPPTILGPTIATQTISIAQEANVSGYSVVATTPDAPAIAQVVGGAGFSVTPSLATILSISPNTSPQGTQITVNVTGLATHWTPATTFSFGAGIVVTSATVNSETSATLTLAIPALAPEGTTSATARTGGEVASLNQAFVITAGTPYLLSSGPGSVEQQGSAVFTILAQATNWTAATPPVVSYGSDITLGPVQVTSPTTLTVQGAVSATAYPGYRNLTVTTGTQVLGINSAVYIAPGPAVINSVTPNTGGQGVQFANVQINGINTHWVQGTTMLNFPGVLVNSFSVNSPTSITANITVDLTANPGQVNVTATTLGEVATEVNAFTITQTQAELAFVNPSSLPQGQTQSLTITGIDTSFASGTTVVTSTSSGITVNSTTVNSPTSLTVSVTVAPTITLGYKNITVTTGAQIVSSNSLFQVTLGPAAISGLNPNDGGEGQTVQVGVTGSQTHFAQGVTTASFAGGISVTGVTVQSLTQATVTVFIPNTVPLASYNVTLTTGGEVATILNGFTVNSGLPSISVVDPPTGTQGITTNVALTGLFTNWVQGTSVASFGSGITVNTLTVNSATSATANITISQTATIGSRNVSVTTGAQVASITGGFSVLTGVPALVSSTPGSGQAGSTVNLIIDGVFTNFQQAFSTVSVGDGVSTNFITVDSPTQVTANVTIPSTATVESTYVSVTTNGTTLTLNNAFSVLAGTPAITQINPNIGTDGQTLNVTITGLYTDWIQGTTTVSFGSGITVNTVTVNATNSLVANITIGASAATGPYTVMTTTGGEVETVPGGFTVEPATIPAPTLLSVSPGVNAGSLPINSVFTFVFSQPMDRTTLTTSTMEFWLISNPSGWVTLPGTITVDATGRVVTFTPNSLLAVNSQYYVLLTSGIKDAAETAFSQWGYQSFYTNDSANTTPATVVAANPPANATNVGTNVTVELEFSADMNQSTQSGFVVSTGGNPVPGTISWNSNVNCCSWGPGTLAYFTPASPLAANTVYKVSYGAPLADTAGNSVTPGSFTFTTGAGADTVTNNVGYDFDYNQTNLATNFAPQVLFSKPINPIDINTGTLLLYNSDSGKYIEGSVTVAPNGMSATFTPTVSLLPDTYYRLYMAGGYYDMDGNYLNGNNSYFTTGAGSDTTPPTVTSVSPANNATAVPLNSQIMVTFSSPINAENINVITVTPSGGSAIAGTASLASDLVTLTFVPAVSLQPGTVYTVQVSGYSDLVGNAGTPSSTTFTTAASAVVLNVSTGVNASGQAILTGDTQDTHWKVVTYTGIGIPAGESDILYPDCNSANYSSNTNLLNCTLPTPTSGAITFNAPAYTVAPGDADWYGGWVANGPNSSWIALNPTSANGNTGGFYYTSFMMPTPLPSGQICIAGTFAHDDNGLLAVNGTTIMGDQGTNGGSPAALNINITKYLLPGLNYLNYAPGSTDNNLEGVNLDAVIETCGASYTGGLSLTNATPANNATAVATNTTITLTFNNVLNPATVNSTTLPVMVNWNSNQEIGGAYVVTGNQVVFTPDSPFPVSTNIWVGAYNGPTDLAGDSAATCGTNCYTQLTNFTTGTTATAPSSPFQVIAFTPPNNATNIGLRAPVTATFNRSVNPGSINPNNASADFGLFAGDSQSPWCGGGSYSRSQDNTTLSFTCYALPSSTTMTAVLNSNLTDWTGDALAPFTSQFTTMPYDSNTNATVISTRPGSGASGIGVNQPIIIYTSLPINAATANGGIEVAQNNVAVPGSVSVLDGGYTLEFTPSTPWTPGALIQWWTTGSLYDSTYNTPLNGASGYFYVAASTATVVPALQVASPVSYSTAAINSIVDLQFNVPLNPSTVNSTNVYLYDQQTTLNVPATISMPQPNEIRLVPSANFTPGHYIFVYLTTGVQSTTSVPFGSNTWVTYFYANNPVDSTLPAVQSAVPFNGDSGVGVNATPGVVINKSIDPVSVNSNTFKVTNGGTPLAGGFWFNSNDTRVEFVPSAPLPANTNLVMTLSDVLDIVGNPLNFSSSFTTGPGPDFTQPTVVWSSVASSESIPINSAITVQFSESMDVTTFTAGQPNSCGNFYIYDYLEGTCIATTLTWSSNQQMAYLVPSAPLSAGRSYGLWVQGGTDLAGNTVSGYQVGFYGEFTTASSAPTVIAFNPLNGATGLGTNAIIEAEFSGPIDPTTIGNVTLSTGGSTVATSPNLGSGNSVLQLIPAVPLLPNTNYVMTIAGVKDTAGNAVATVNNSFTTGPTYDITSANAINSDPGGGSVAGINVTPKLVFNKPLNPITVNNNTFRMYLQDTNQWIPLTVTESTNGMEVTMVPQIPLLPNTRYYFEACCGFQDQDGNGGNGVQVYFTTSGGAVTTGPTVTVSPANATTAVPLNAQIYVTVSASIDPTSWTQNSIQVLNGSTPVAGTVSVPNLQTLIFTPSAALTASTTYTVNVNGFTDANGNAVVASATSFTTGTVPATGGLTLTSTSIVNGSNVTNNLSPITVTFSQPIDPLTVNLSTMLVMNSWNSNWGLAGTYVVNGNAVTFTPSNPYPPNATIYFGATGGLTDLAGDAYGGNPGDGWQQLVSFTTTGDTPDSTPLTVLSVSPASGATNVRPDVPVSVTFNKGINPYSIYNNNNNALLFAGQGLQDRGSVSMSADNRTMTFNSGTLYNSATYTIQLPAGGISDPSGNSLATTFSSTFVTGVNPATGNGSVQSEEPGNNSTGNPTDTNLTLFMNRQVNASTLPGQLTVTVNGAVYVGTVTATADDYEIQYTPTTPFPAGATIQWFLSGSVLDLNGDAFYGNSGSFYIAPAVNTATAVPTVVAVSPGDGSANVPVNAEFDIQYSQPVTAASFIANMELYDWGTGTSQTVDVTPNTGNSTVFHVTLASPPLSPSTQYGLCTNGNVMGANGVAAQSDCWATIGTTVASTTPDTTSGTVTIGPPNGSQNLGTNAYIRFQFSKPADRTTVNANTIAVTTGGNPIPGSFSYNYSGDDLVGADFNPVNPLPQSSTIQVAVSGILDYAGNEFSEPTTTFTTGAQPDYTTPTATLAFGYWQSGIGTNASFTCLYSEAMDPSSVTPSNTYIYSYVTNAHVPVTYTWASDLMSVTMTPVSPLYADSQYIYYCQGAIDLTGIGQQNNSAGFYTGSGPVAVGPSLVYANPPSGMTNVPLNSIGGPWNNTSLMLLFNEPVSSDSMNSITFTPQGGSPEPIAVYAQDGNYIADVQLPWALAPNTQYTFNFAGVTDLNGNPAQGTTTSSFTTGTGFDFTNPTATAATPVNNATGVAVNAPITLTFSELMNSALITSSQIYLRTHNTQTTVPTTLAISTVGGVTVVTVTPVSPLAESTIYDLVYWPNNWYLYDVAGNYEPNYGVETTFTTGTTAAVNGACGTASGGSFSAPPTANLCTATGGIASAITNVAGAWSWTCNGQYGGTNAACSATITGTPACFAQPSSLVSLWPGNNSATDAGPGGNNGTLENGVTYALGEVGDAFNLSGNTTSSSDQYVLIGQPVPTNLQIQSAITLSAWIYPTAYPTDYGSGAMGLIAGSQDDGVYGGATIFYDARVNPDGNPYNVPAGHIQFNLGNGSNWALQDTETQVPLNQWTLITATATSGGSGQVYYNGVLQPSNSGNNATTWNGTISYPTSDWFGIGQEVNENRPFVGLINDVAVFNAALTQTQITALYNAGSGGICQ